LKCSAKEANSLFGSVEAYGVVNDPFSMVGEGEERGACREIEEFIERFDIRALASGFILGLQLFKLLDSRTVIDFKDFPTSDLSRAREAFDVGDKGFA